MAPRPDGVARSFRRGWPTAAVMAAGLCLAGCAAVSRFYRATADVPVRFDEETFTQKAIRTYRLRAGPPPPDTVIGATRHYRIRDGDTLLDVARWYDLGYNEIVDANPGLDPFVPPVGADIVVPTEWVLPCCTYEGIVVNIPEMRLYYFRRPVDDPHAIVVDTYPVGLGRDDRQTPRGRFQVVARTVNPTWHIPESIRQEHIRERGDARHVIAGGDPDNPLGRYRLQLSRRLYGIHGTDTPWGVGMQVTHGCIRLYPEDIERLFPLVPVGTPVEFTYQPVKVGTRGTQVYVEVHRDIYRRNSGRSPSLASFTRSALAHRRLEGRIEPGLIDAAIKSAAGVPVRISPDGTAARGHAG